MRNEGLFKALDSGNPRSETTINRLHSRVRQCVPSGMISLSIAVPMTTRDMMDIYSMALVLLLNPSIYSGLLSDEEYNTLMDILTKAVNNYNAHVEVQSAPKKALASLVSSWG